MNISEFSKKYGLGQLTVDYYTNLGLLHPTVNENNGYREYGPNTEEEVKLILIADAMGAGPAKEYVEVLKILPKREWQKFVKDRIKEELEKAILCYQQVLTYVNEIMEG